MAETTPGSVGTFVQNLPSGERQAYHFICREDNSATDIYINPHGSTVDMNASGLFSKKEVEGYEKVAELKSDEEYLVSLYPDNAPARMVVRISHFG